MIVVDSSVWIDHLNGVAGPEVLKLATLIRADDPICVGDVVLCEVLMGLASEREAERVERDLREFDVVSMVSDDLAVKAPKNFRQLRRHGVTIRKTIDLFIGTYCIEHRHILLHRDRDFDAMERHLGLTVLPP